MLRKLNSKRTTKGDDENGVKHQKGKRRKRYDTGTAC